MDARDRLRIYLEQRREMGETELVLDTLTVDEAMRLLGAGTGGGSGKGARVAEGPARDIPQLGERAANTNADTNEDVNAGFGAGPDADARDSRGTRSAASGLNSAGEMGDWRAMLSDSDPSRQRTGVKQPLADRKEPTRETASGTPAPQAASDASASQDAPGTGTRQSASRASGSPAASGKPAAQGTPERLIIAPVERTAGTSHPAFSASTMDEIAAAVTGCRLCPLGATALNPVPGEGSPTADLVCVGEAPGATEDETGRPFVGAAGKLFTSILGAIQLQREDVFICNVLKHRPPGNRNPAPEEVSACSPYLVRQLELVRPKVILALGTFAAQTLLETKLTIGKLRGTQHSFHGIPLIVTYHPAALLRNPAWKRPTWEDVQHVRRILDRPDGA